MSTSALVPAPEPVPSWFSELLAGELEPWLELSQTQIGQLFVHYNLLVRWNEKMNLTTVKPGREMVIRHYCESLFFAAHLVAPEANVSVLDLGSGAGFPGVPIAVLRPAWKIGLVESNQRKAVFLRESSRHLANTSVLAQRMENLTVHSDWVVARALDPREVMAQVPRLALSVGLMLGAEDFSSLQQHPGIAWREPIQLPWGDRRICVYGSTWNVAPST